MQAYRGEWCCINPRASTNWFDFEFAANNHDEDGVKFHLCGLEVTHRRPGLGAGLLAQITKQVSVRCLVDKAGLTQIFPRPYCHLLAQGLVVNGQLFDPMYGPLDTFRVVWPELETELGQRLGSFVCEES